MNNKRKMKKKIFKCEKIERRRLVIKQFSGKVLAL
jgi:hypothetical protein